MVCQPTSEWMGYGARVIYNRPMYMKANSAKDKAGEAAAVSWPLTVNSAPIYDGFLNQIGTSSSSVKFNFGQFMDVAVGGTLVSYGYVWSSPVSGWINLSNLSSENRTLLKSRAPATNPNLPADTSYDSYVWTFGYDPSFGDWEGFRILDKSGSQIGLATDYLMRSQMNYVVNVTFGLPNGDGKYTPADGGFSIDSVPSVRSPGGPATFKRYSGVAPRSIFVYKDGIKKEMAFVFGRVFQGSTPGTYGWVARAALT